MDFHRDPDVDAALLRLMDALCSDERATGRDNTLILVPHCADEVIIIAHGGKPIRPGIELQPGDLLQQVGLAVGERERLARLREFFRTEEDP